MYDIEGDGGVGISEVGRVRVGRDGMVEIKREVWKWCEDCSLLCWRGVEVCNDDERKVARPSMLYIHLKYHINCAWASRKHRLPLAEAILDSARMSE